MDPLTRGALFHEVQRDLFRALDREGLLPLDASHMEKVRAIADCTLDAVAAAYEDKLAPAIPRVWRSEIEEIRTDLHGWLPYLSRAAIGFRRISNSRSAFGTKRGATPAALLNRQRFSAAFRSEAPSIWWSAIEPGASIESSTTKREKLLSGNSRLWGAAPRCSR